MTDAVDDITTVDDFLAVSENHILEDVNDCVAALQVGALVPGLVSLTTCPSGLIDLF